MSRKKKKMLLPISKMKNLASTDARPLGDDAVVRAVLAVKHAEKVTQAQLQALEALGPLDVSLVVTHADWTNGSYPLLTYAVEDYAFLDNDLLPTNLYRYADNDQGVWWAGQWINARMHGKGFHENPAMHKVPPTARNVLARLRTRFGTTYSPHEFIAI